MTIIENKYTGPVDDKGNGFYILVTDSIAKWNDMLTKNKVDEVHVRSQGYEYGRLFRVRFTAYRDGVNITGQLFGEEGHDAMVAV
jgi:hypothetical protein